MNTGELPLPPSGPAERLSLLLPVLTIPALMLLACICFFLVAILLG